MRTSFFFFPALLLAVLCTNCYKEPQTIVETVTKRDTLFVATHDTIFQQVTDTLTLTQLADTVTTFILVRHAETSGTAGNPSLNLAGQVRAAELARILENVPLQAVYATNYARTTQTGQTTATAKGLAVQLYDPLEPDPFADELVAAYHGRAVLVVGHSNTIPALLNVLTGSNDFSNIAETEYDNLYVATVFKKGLAQVVHLKYGE